MNDYSVTKNLLGITEYRVGGKLHRTNGPAVMWDDGGWEWTLYGKRHRYYGPATSWAGWRVQPNLFLNRV